MSKDSNLVAPGSRIRKLRKSLGFSQEQFAWQAEVDRSYVGEIERGERCELLALVKIAECLDCDIATFKKGIPERDDE